MPDTPNTHCQGEFLRLPRPDCPFCRQLVAADSASVRGFVRVVELLTFEDWGTEPPSIEVCGLIERAPFPTRAGQYVYCTLQCEHCHLVFDAPNACLPEELATDLHDALICHRVGAYRATALICRRILETFASAAAPAPHSLADKLALLIRQNLLNGASIHWADRLKYFGNLAAHPQRKPEHPEDMELFCTIEKSFAPLFLALALIQTFYVAPPTESCSEHGVFTTSWR